METKILFELPKVGVTAIFLNFRNEERVMRFERVRYMFLRNSAVKRDVDNKIIRAERNKVNLNTWTEPGRSIQNVGDCLSEVVVRDTADYYGINYDKYLTKTKHLYAIGSILLGYQDATIWGSGFLNDPTKSKSFGIYKTIHRVWHSTDVRAVRGPATKKIFDTIGIKCPAIYGDPAILMPLFYQPRISYPNREYVIIPHFNEFYKYKDQDNVLSTFSNSYENFIDMIVSAEVVVSSSLHGIILAEAYGRPAVLLKPSITENMFKYQDYYESTQRNSFLTVSTLKEALSLHIEKPDDKIMKLMQHSILQAFPCDLWDN